jgi:hypothetical protein
MKESVDGREKKDQTRTATLTQENARLVLVEVRECGAWPVGGWRLWRTRVFLESRRVGIRCHPSPFRRLAAGLVKVAGID